MKRLIAAFAISAAFLTFSATAAHAKAGEPVTGTPIGLEGDPGSIVAPILTDVEGNVTFRTLSPGRYTVVLIDMSKLTAPASLHIVRITNIRANAKVEEPLVSGPIQPGKKGAKAYALDRNGSKLVVTFEAAGGSITVHLQTDK